MRCYRIGECAIVAIEAVLRPYYGLDRKGMLFGHGQSFQLYGYTTRQWRTERPQRNLKTMNLSVFLLIGREMSERVVVCRRDGEAK